MERGERDGGRRWKKDRGGEHDVEGRCSAQNDFTVIIVLLGCTMAHISEHQDTQSSGFKYQMQNEQVLITLTGAASSLGVTATVTISLPYFSF